MKLLKMVALAGLVFGWGGVAWGQGPDVTGGNIPAPKLYGESADCTMGPDTVVNKRKAGMYRQKSLLDTLLDDDAALANAMLTAIITVGSACEEANPVAAGFEVAEDLYRDAAAAKRLAEVDDPDPDHVTEYAEAKSARDAYGGDVYEAIYTQLSRQATARKAIEDYNDIVEGGGSLEHAKGLRDTINITAAGNSDLVGYTPDDDQTADTDEEVIGDFGGEDAVEGYHAILGFNTNAETSPLDEGEFSDTFENAFTTTGALQLVEDSDGAPEASSAITTLGTISTQLDLWNDAVDQAASNLEDATELGVADLDPLRETLRKATAGRDHVGSELKRLTNIVRAKDYQTGLIDHDNDSVTDTQAVAVSSLISNYNDQVGEKDDAEDDVRDAVKALENARNGVQDAMSNPGDFLQQVVDLRTYQRDQRQDAVDEFDEGDAPESVTDALDDANEALTAAETARNAHTTLVGDESNPASALITALLETDAKVEDDGQALVNAISSNYGIANEAKTTADDAKAAVEGLGGSEGTVALNTGKITENAGNITSLDGRVAANEGEIGMDENGMSRIDHNEARSMANATEIGMDENGMSRIDYNETRSMANATAIAAEETARMAEDIRLEGRIDTNWDAIAVNQTDIATNEMGISDNAGEIMRVEGRVDTNWDAIAANQMSIDANASGVSSNADAIAANMNSIGTNAGSISDNRNMIGELSDDLDVVRAGVAASMALAGMPAINGRGISIGVGSFDGESAFAVGFQIQGEMASFKVGITSGGGATGASAGVGFQF